MVRKVVGTVLALLLVAAAFAAGIGASAFDLALFGTKSESRNTQVVKSITREEQVVLLGLGIQGIQEQNEQGTILGWDVPGTSRASFMQYTYGAKLGIDGKLVTIEETGTDSFRVSIPEFIFIGHDDVDFKMVAEDNGVLSFVTAEVDEVAMVNQILDDETRAKHVADNADMLREQAESFYTGIIKGVDPDVDLTFEFAS